jgi:hypothetical protein
LDKTPEPNKPALQRARECFSLSLSSNLRRIVSARELLHSLSVDCHQMRLISVNDLILHSENKNCLLYLVILFFYSMDIENCFDCDTNTNQPRNDMKTEKGRRNKKMKNSFRSRCPCPCEPATPPLFALPFHSTVHPPSFFSLLILPSFSLSLYSPPPHHHFHLLLTQTQTHRPDHPSSSVFSHVYTHNKRANTDFDVELTN